MGEQACTPAVRSTKSEVEIEFPATFVAADSDSLKAQNAYLASSVARLVGLLVAAVCAATAGALGGSQLLGWFVLGGFVVAACAEMFLIASQPERDWYAGRAIAESVKTLAWRFSVGGEPFGPGLTMYESERLLRTRVAEVIDGGKDRICIGVEPAVVTDSMRALRSADFETRRKSYLKSRTRDQRAWYSRKAQSNARRARGWRLALIVGEILAVAAAVASLSGGWAFDFAGVVAALVAAGAAWLAVKQHSQVASAYRVAAAELAIQDEVLCASDADSWPQAVADAEEAISREHTMWLASRGVEPMEKNGLGRR